MNEDNLVELNMSDKHFIILEECGHGLDDKRRERDEQRYMCVRAIDKR